MTTSTPRGSEIECFGGPHDGLVLVTHHPQVELPVSPKARVVAVPGHEIKPALDTVTYAWDGTTTPRGRLRFVVVLKAVPA